MHNNIMAVGSRDRPPMLATGRYAQWRSRFLRYIDTRPNGDALRKCILKGPYTPTIVTTPVVPATEDSPAVPEQTTVETVMNMTPENRAHFESEKEAIHLILTGIGDEMGSHQKATIDPEQAQKDKDNIKNNMALIGISNFRNSTNLPTTTELPQTPETRMWILLQDTDEEIDEQELEAHYSYIAKIQEVPNADSGTYAEPLEHVQYDTDDNVFANDIQHFDQSESISNTCAVETGDSNVTPDSPDMFDNDIRDDQNDVECDDERVALANLIANLKLDVDENKKIQKQLKKANATLTQKRLTEWQIYSCGKLVEH
ncbi:hypothetical protein Tco_0517970 [Tanacetum coccineum]